MDKISSFIVSFFLSLLLFYSLFFALVVKTPKQVELNFIEIDFLESFVETSKEQKSKETSTPKPKEPEATKSTDLDNFFKDTNVEEIAQELRNHNYKIKEIDTKEAKLDLNKILKETKPNVQNSAGQKTDQTTQDKYLKLIHAKIFSVWNTRPEDANKKAWIVFTVFKDGSFIYYIKSISYGDEFKTRLEKSLQTLQAQKLPPPDERLRLNVHFVAKE